MVCRLGAVYAVDHPDTLNYCHNSRQQAAYAFPDVVSGQVLGLQTHREGQEGDGRSAVDSREEEGQEEEGYAAGRTGYNNGLLPEEGQQEAGHGAQADDHVDDSCFIEGTRSKAVHQSDEEGPDVCHLDEDREVRGQVPALGDLWDNERQLHPEAVDGDPGAHPEQTGQQVGEERHVGRWLLLTETDVKFESLLNFK